MEKNFNSTEIITNPLVPFISKYFSDSHRFMRDNDPKQTSHLAQFIIVLIGGKPHRNPPNMNPIENFWAELKAFLQTEI